MNLYKVENANNLKLAIIGDQVLYNYVVRLRIIQDTVTGFLLAGIGEINGRGEKNYLVVDNHTTKATIEDTFKEYSETRHDIGIIIINQHIADQIRYKIDDHTCYFPTILEIPSKDKPYDITKVCISYVFNIDVYQDSVIQKLKGFNNNELHSN